MTNADISGLILLGLMSHASAIPYFLSVADDPVLNILYSVDSSICFLAAEIIIIFFFRRFSNHSCPSLLAVDLNVSVFSSLCLRSDACLLCQSLLFFLFACIYICVMLRFQKLFAGRRLTFLAVFDKFTCQQILNDEC